MGNAHLVGSIPLHNAEEVLNAVAGELGPYLTRLPDGETGPRSDWIVWQYPVLNSCQEFEVCPPGGHPYRSLPRLRLRDGCGADDIDFGELGYATAARASFATFARLKRERVVPEHCRFQVSLPTPLAPISAFVFTADQAAVEPLYEERLLDELADILSAVPHDQLAIQWDTNFEFAMLAGELPCWFADVRAGVIERLLRIASHVPDDVAMGYHFCHGHDRTSRAPGRDVRARVEIANALSASLSRPLNWLHLPLPEDRTSQDDYEPLMALTTRPETEVFLGIVAEHDDELTSTAKATLARRYLPDFGISSPCGWGRLRHDRIRHLLEVHARLAEPVGPRVQPPFAWPAGFEPVPDEAWTRAPLDDSARAYDLVDSHSWYANLTPLIDDLAEVLQQGDIMVDYSGGTGILVDRLKLRVFDRAFGAIIVDSSPKFLRVAVEKFAGDPTVGFRQLRYLRDEQRLQDLDEALGSALASRPVDVIVSTNAIHLYPEFGDTAQAWARALRPDGKVLLNSVNLRNPAAADDEWILDETVWVIGDLAEGIVRSDDALAAYRPALDDVERMKRHHEYRDRVFLEPRPLSYYVDALEHAGFVVAESRATIDVRVDEWFQFLCAYDDAVLGWVGGTEKVDGAAPDAQAVEDRLQLMRRSVDLLFGSRDTFRACWTYLTGTRATDG